MTLSDGRGLRLVIIGLTVLIGLQISATGLAYLVRTKELGYPARPRTVEHVAAAATLIESLPEEWRENALRAVSTPLMRFSLRRSYTEDPESFGAVPQSARPLGRAYARALGERRFRIYARRPRFLPPLGKDREPLRAPIDVVVIVELRDGTALVVEPSRLYREQQALGIASFWSAVLGVALLIGLARASLATTRPIRDVGRAAARLAGDLNAAPIEEKGPAPVRELARAFNRMQSDVKRLVSERAVALAAVAHDYRTYLTRLRLRADFIVDDVQRDKAIADIEEMAALIDDTLLYARQQEDPARAEAIDLSVLARDVASRLRDAGKSATVATDGLVRVRANALSLRRALANLADNAAKYGEAAHIRVEASGGKARAIVEDEGRGVDDAALARLTEPFYRVENSRSRATGGSGLGLAIAKTLVEGAGGELGLSRGANGGLRAEIALPLHEKDAVTRAPSP